MVGRISAANPATIVCTTTWWENVAVDVVIRAACSASTARVVEIGGLYLDPLNRAGWERSSLDDGVAIHPGDRGMEQLANTILRALAP